MEFIKGRGIVYRHINNINGKTYIGSTYDLKRRSYQHITDLNRNAHHCKHLQRAWNKYGKEAFRLSEIIEEFDLPQIANTTFTKRTIWKPIIIAREQHYIDTLKPEYNTCKEATSRLGVPHLPETTAKMRQSHKRKWQEPEHRAKMLIAANDPIKIETLRQANLGRVHSDEAKAKNSAASQAMWDAHPERREEFSRRQTAIMTLPENRIKYRDARLGKTLVEMFGGERAAEIQIKRKANTDEVARGKAISKGKMGKPRPDLKGKAGRSSISGEYGVILRTDSKRWSVQINGTRYGTFLTQQEAIARRDFVVEALKTDTPIPKAFKTNKGGTRPEEVCAKIRAGHALRRKL